MIVKPDTANTSVVLLILALLALPSGVASLTRCNRGVLNNYGLAGRTYGTSYPMKVCQHILDSCCSIADDVKIVSLWNAHTRPIIQRHTSYCINNLEAIISYFYPLSELDPQLIVVKQVTLRKTPYMQSRCVRVTRRMNRFQRNNFLQFTDRRVRNRNRLFENGRRHWGVFANMTTVAQQRPLIQMKRGRNRSYFTKVNRDRLRRVRERRRQVRRARNLEQAEPKSKDVARVNELMGLNEPLVRRSGDKITLEVVKSFVNERGLKITPREVGLIGRKLGLVGGKKAALEGRRLSDDLTPNTQTPFPPVERSLSDSEKSAKKVKSTDRKLQGRRRRRNNCGPPPPNTRPMPRADTFLQIPRPRLTTLQCRQRRSSYFRDYVVVNPRKVRFCYGIYQDFLSYNMVYFNQTLGEVKKNMAVFGDLRKQFFCSICDGHAQNYFDHKKRLMIYKNDFCSHLISEFLDYLQFINVLFVEFADSLMQYVQCFETDGNIYNFPFQNFLVKYRRRIHFFKRCFASVTAQDPAYMKNCWFICNKFSFLRMNPLFDGDLPLLTRIRIALFSFLRKFSQQNRLDRRNEARQEAPRNVSRIDLGLIENVNGILIEPVSPGLLVTNRRIYLGARDRQRVWGNSTIGGLNTLPPDVMSQVNNFLTSVNLRSVHELVDNFRRNAEQINNGTLAQMRRRRPFDETLHVQSRVNGMMNKLWNLQSKQNVSAWMMPPRQLRAAAAKIIQEAGFEPVTRERRLQQFELFPAIGTPAPQFSPVNNTIDHPNTRTHTGKRIRIKNPDVPVDEQDLRFIVESPSEIFEKIEETIDMYGYGTAFADDGLNPLAYVYQADFERNVTNIINEHFDVKERLDGEVLIDYLAYNSKKINEFNELFDNDIEGFNELKHRDKKYNRLKSAGNYALIYDRFKLRKEAESQQKQVLVTSRGDLAKRRREIQRQKLIRKYEQAKAYDALEQPDLSQHLMSNLPSFQDTFSGMSGFFAKLFGY